MFRYLRVIVLGKPVFAARAGLAGRTEFFVRWQAIRLILFAFALLARQLAVQRSKSPLNIGLFLRSVLRLFLCLLLREWIIGKRVALPKRHGAGADQNSSDSDASLFHGVPLVRHRRLPTASESEQLRELAQCFGP